NRCHSPVPPPPRCRLSVAERCCAPAAGGRTGRVVVAEGAGRAGACQSQRRGRGDRVALGSAEGGESESASAVRSRVRRRALPGLLPDYAQRQVNHIFYY
ncbi:Protein of unknown function, partial [Gryllus bimaculatus]